MQPDDDATIPAGDADARGGSIPDPKAPKAVPAPSKASKDRPVPKPMRSPTPRPVRPADVPPEPSGAIRGQPVPKPVRAAPPSAVDTPGAEPAAPAAPPEAGDEGATEKKNPLAGITKVGIPGTQSWARTTGSVSKNTTRPGVTQALKLGPGDTGTKAPLTTHALRNQERVNIKQDIDVIYTISSPHGDASQEFEGKLVDISLGGAQLEGPIPPDVTPQQLKAQSFICAAQIELPFVENPLAVTAQITWTKPAGEGIYFLGLKFINMAEQQRRTVRAFLIGLQSPTRMKFRRGPR